MQILQLVVMFPTTDKSASDNYFSYLAVIYKSSAFLYFSTFLSQAVSNFVRYVPDETQVGKIGSKYENIWYTFHTPFTYFT